MAGFALGAALAAFAVAHATLALSLAASPPRWHAVVALLVPPLAPWWGWRARMRWRTVAWASALALYALGVLGALFGRAT